MYLKDGMLNYNTNNYISVVAIALQETIKKLEIEKQKSAQLEERLRLIEEKLGLV